VTIRPRRGGYQVIVYAGIDPITGRQRQIARQVKGKREAERLEAKLRAEVAAGRHRGTGARTVGELLDVYLAWREASGKPLSPDTLNDYRTIVEIKLKPALGKLRLPQLDPVTLDRFYGQLRRRGRNDSKALSGSRIRQVHAVLSGALGLAVRYGWIGFNPARLATPPAAQSQQRRVPTPAEVREVLTVAERVDPTFGLYLRLCATTGLRPGEVCALRWCDLDLKAGELSVSGNIVHTRGLESGYVRKGPKSEHGERLVALDPRTVELLRAHQRRRRLRARAWNGKLAEDAYLFSIDEAGRHPVRADTVGKRFRALAAHLGHSYTLYGLRHFMATQLGAVASTSTVRERMGHGSLQVTSIYTHRVSEADRAAAMHMSSLLDGDPSSRSGGQASSE
jgi:integrase